MEGNRTNMARKGSSRCSYSVRKAPKKSGPNWLVVSGSGNKVSGHSTKARAKKAAKAKRAKCRGRS